MKIVIDTSVIIAIILEEPTKNSLIKLTEHKVTVCPPSVEWEIGNSLSALLKRKLITRHVAVEAIKAYRNIDIEFVDSDLVAAIELADRYNIYAYDAYIIECAMKHNHPLLTLDKSMKRIAKIIGTKIIEVDQ